MGIELIEQVEKPQLKVTVEMVDLTVGVSFHDEGSATVVATQEEPDGTKTSQSYEAPGGAVRAALSIAMSFDGEGPEFEDEDEEKAFWELAEQAMPSDLRLRWIP